MKKYWSLFFRPILEEDYQTHIKRFRDFFFELNPDFRVRSENLQDLPEDLKSNGNSSLTDLFMPRAFHQLTNKGLFRLIWAILTRFFALLGKYKLQNRASIAQITLKNTSYS